MTDRTYIKSLLEGYMQDRLSAGETTVLMQLIEERRDPQFWDELVAEITEGQQSDPITDTDSWQPYLSALMEKAKAAEAMQERPALIAKSLQPRRYTIRKIIAWTTAAACAGLILGGIYYWAGRQTPPVNTANTNGVEMPGAATKAKLTLSDGSTVMLDSSGNQVITAGDRSVQQQGGLLQYKDEEGGGEVAYHTLATPRGGRFRVKLPDGTTVWLNAATSLRYPTSFTGGSRQVWVKGEAYFEVAPNMLQPFIATVEGGMSIQVLGTAFNVRAYAEERQSAATLITGAVRVSHASESEVLRPGQSSKLEPGKNLEIVPADVEAITAWKENKFVFHNIPIPALLDEIARWYDVDILYMPGFDKSERYNGEISRDVELSVLLQMIEKSAVGKFRIEGRKLIALPVVE